jgi:5-methylthioribose kinase
MPGELDIEQTDDLIAWLRRTGKIGSDETPLCKNLAGGVSNRTVLVERASDEAWVMKQALEKLRVKADWFSSPLRIHREASGLRHLEKLAPSGAITPLIFEDDEFHLLAMAAVPQPHENWKTLLLAGTVERDHVDQFATLLGNIQLGAMRQRDKFAPLFEDNSFFESLRLEPYYQYTSTQAPETRSFYETLIRDTRANRFTIVHGDYSPKNILVYQGKLVLLDHEVIHFGDGTFDIGFAMAHFLSKAHHLSKHRATFAAAARQFWDTYTRIISAAVSVSDLEPRAARHALACLLARVAGRSPLEYLDDMERARQRKVVAAIIQNPPQKISDVITQFVEQIAKA